MSAINDALTDLAEKRRSTQNIVRADVPKIKQRPVLPWLIAGFTLSMAMGGWAVSQSQPISVTQPSYSSQPINGEQASVEVMLAPSPTSKKSRTDSELYFASNSVAQPTGTTEKAGPVPVKKITTSKTAPVKEHRENTNAIQPQNVIVEQVELSPEQLAQKAIIRAEKAMESNKLDEALTQFQIALRHTPSDSNVRKKLAALYYGKGDTRKAAELLQKGIRQYPNDEDVRIALAKLLIKENQQQAALVPLMQLTKPASVKYLSLRAALAQKANQDALALESYQQLVQLEPENGRWWLGLGIQQERALNLTSAQQSYKKALLKVGISSQSQQFIRDRLTLLSRLEEKPNAN